eukprot:4466805-Ditylum_brightwellii.AAC.1
MDKKLFSFGTFIVWILRELEVACKESLKVRKMTDERLWLGHAVSVFVAPSSNAGKTPVKSTNEKLFLCLTMNPFFFLQIS